jgi:hypothetical protein
MPVIGVVALGWDVLPLLLLFWLENVAIGVFNVARMLVAAPAQTGSWFAKLFYIPFFCFHYGMFTTVHGALLIEIFAGRGLFGRSMPDLPELVGWTVTSQKLGWAALALALSHAVSFVTNYLGSGEYRKAGITELMFRPYGRVVLLHVTILLGGLLATALHAHVAALLFLVAMKIAIDLLAHLHERRKWAEGAPGRKDAQPRAGASGTDRRSAA